MVQFGPLFASTRSATVCSATASNDMRQLFQHHPVTGYYFVPGLRARIIHEAGGYIVQTNSAGFRSKHEFRTAKDRGTKRILLFGDSFTAGDGVSNADRYSDLLETLAPGLEVFNYAIPGTGTDQQYLAYREFAQDKRRAA